MKAAGVMHTQEPVFCNFIFYLSMYLFPLLYSKTPNSVQVN